MIKNHSVAFAWFGILAAVAFAIAWMCASSLDTLWVFGEDKLSVLGISDTDAKYYFNYGCLVTGVLVAIFGYGITVCAKNDGHTVGGVLLVLAGIALALVGIFTMDYGNGNIHQFAAVMMTVFIVGAAIAIAAGDWADHLEPIAGITIVIMGMLIATFFAQSFASFEAWAVITGLVWLIIQGGKMIAFGNRN